MTFDEKIKRVQRLEALNEIDSSAIFFFFG